MPLGLRITGFGRQRRVPVERSLGSELSVLDERVREVAAGGFAENHPRIASVNRTATQRLGRQIECIVGLSEDVLSTDVVPENASAIPLQLDPPFRVVVGHDQIDLGVAERAVVGTANQAVELARRFAHIVAKATIRIAADQRVGRSHERGQYSTIRIDWKMSAPSEYAICFHCQTNLMQNFREWFPDNFQFDGNRRIVFNVDDPVPAEPLSVCIAAALTYHRNKRSMRV
jgi:hypothetical protein